MHFDVTERIAAAPGPRLSLIFGYCFRESGLFAPHSRWARSAGRSAQIRFFVASGKPRVRVHFFITKINFRGLPGGGYQAPHGHAVRTLFEKRS